MASRQSFSGLSSAGGSRPASSLGTNLSASDLAAELRGVVDLRRRNDELERELIDARLQLDGEKQRVRDANRERTSALKAQREELSREREHLLDVARQRAVRDYREKLEREREKEKKNDDDALLRQVRRKDEEIRTLRAEVMRERDDFVRRTLQEREEAIRDACEQQATQHRAKLMAEMWGLREQKMRVEQMLEARIESEHERINEIRRLEDQHERDLEELMRKSRSESVREVQKIRLAERIVLSKDEDITYFQQLAERLAADNEKLTDEITRMRVAETMERRVAKAIESSPRLRRKRDSRSLQNVHSGDLSPGSGYATPTSTSPNPERREKPTSAMAGKITRLEATIKTLEEKIGGLKQENVTLAQKAKVPVRTSSSRSSSSSCVTSLAAGEAEGRADESTTIRRLRKNNVELNTAVTQLKAKVKLLEGDRERSARTEPHGARVTRHESLLHRRSSSRQETPRAAESRPDAVAVATAAATVAEAQVARLKERLRALEGLQEENVTLVQHITRLSSEKMLMERNCDLQLKSAVRDSESTLSLRNAEVELLHGRVRRLEDKCRSLSLQQRAAALSPSATTPTSARSHHSATGPRRRSSSFNSPDNQQQASDLFLHETDSAPTAVDRSHLGLHQHLSPQPPSPASLSHREQQQRQRLQSNSSSGASTPLNDGSPVVLSHRLSNPSTPLQARALHMTTPTSADGVSPSMSCDHGNSGGVEEFADSATPTMRRHELVSHPTADVPPVRGAWTPGPGPGTRSATEALRPGPAPAVQTRETTATTRTVAYSHDACGDSVEVSEVTSRRSESFIAASSPSSNQVSASTTVTSSLADSIGGSGSGGGHGADSLETVISSMDSLSLSQPPANGLPAEFSSSSSSPSARRQRRCQSPNSLLQAAAAAAAAHSNADEHARPVTPTSGVLSLPTFTLPSPSSPTLSSSSQGLDNGRRSSPWRKTCNSIGGDGGDIIGESPFALPKDASSSPGSSPRRQHTNNGHSPTSEVPEFDSSQQPALGQKMAFRPASPLRLRPVSDLESDASLTPSPNDDVTVSPNKSMEHAASSPLNGKRMAAHHHPHHHHHQQQQQQQQHFHHGNSSGAGELRTNGTLA